MSFAVRFYNFNKKVNSTARPSNEGVVLNCSLLDSCGVVNPTLKLDINLLNAPKYNYAYIAEFGRYYFIDEFVYSDRLWICSMHSDVLASCENQLESKEYLYTRSSSDYDGSIIDGYYPMKTDPIYEMTYGIKPTPTSISNGCYVVGIVGKVSANTEPTGGISYMAMNQSVFNEFRNALFSDDLAYAKSGDQQEDSGLLSLGDSLVKTMFDPFQYVVSCVWVPKLPGSLTFPATEVSYWNVGFWVFAPTSGKIYLIDPSSVIPIGGTHIEIKKHPQSASRGIYLNNSPYSNYMLEIPNLGTFPLDSSKLVNQNYLYIAGWFDPVNESSYYTIETTSTEISVVRNTLIGVIPANLVVKINLSSGGVTVGNVVTHGTESLINTTISGSVGNYAGVASSIINMPSMFRPAPSMVGLNGGIASVVDDSHLTFNLYATFYEISEEDNDHHGRPLMQKRSFSSMSGYNEVLDGDSELYNLTSSEIEQVRMYLESGYYYE